MASRFGLRQVLWLWLSTTVFSYPQAQSEITPWEDMLSMDDLLSDGFEYSSSSESPHLTGDASCVCGKPSTRIIGGEDAEIHNFPWTALLYAVESPRVKIPYCGGALINNLYVLTASHCVDGMPPEKIEVVLRAENISSFYSPYYTSSSIRFRVDEIIKHPAYSRLTLDNDIALIRLSNGAPVEEVSPICVPKEDVTFFQGTSAIVAGYGAVSEAEKPSNNLRKAEVRVLSNELCNSASFHNGKVTENMLCADGPNKGPCAGDTGGPLMIKNKNSARQVLAGIASWSTSCDDPTRPAVYTRVPRFESWVLANTHDAEWCSS